MADCLFVGLEEVAIDLVVNHFGDAAGARGDDGQTGAHGFENHEAQRLSAGGHDKDVAGGIGGGEFFLVQETREERRGIRRSAVRGSCAGGRRRRVPGGDWGGVEKGRRLSRFFSAERRPTYRRSGTLGCPWVRRERIASDVREG